MYTQSKHLHGLVRMKKVRPRLTLFYQSIYFYEKNPPFWENQENSKPCTLCKGGNTFQLCLKIPEQCH